MIQLLILVVAVFGRRELTEYEYKNAFSSFLEKFDKNYTRHEMLERYDVFKTNLDTINEHNAKNLSWTMGVNQFADWTPMEFKAWVKRGNGGGFIDMKQEKKYPEELSTPNCESIDHVELGHVTDVKNQGNCGSCWSFSTTGAIEGAWAVGGHSLVSLSEQELVDCDHTDSGCNGGLMDYAFQWVESHGLCTEEDYPYTATRSWRCKSSSCSQAATISSYTDVPTSETGLQAAVCQQPVSVAIEADQSSFQFYSGGVLTGSCGTQLDHGVLCVGFGTDQGNGYWKVKNSWGSSWGEEGYIRLCMGCGANRSDEGQCGILMSASYPNL